MIIAITIIAAASAVGIFIKFGIYDYYKSAIN